jgi:amino acid adenylation domain-containing protein
MNHQRPRLPEAFLHRAATTPDAVAVEFEGRQVSYRELAAWSGDLAVRLRGLGVGPDVLVGVALDRSVELVAAILGILRAGGAWVPLDPSYPAERLSYMLADSGVALLVTDSDDRLPGAGVRRIDPAARAGNDGDIAVELGDHNLAYMIYTSGSTGRPKGVLLTHGGLAAMAAAQRRAFAVEPDARILQFAPASFDASVFELTMALCAGATLVLAPRPAIAPGVDLWNTLHRNRITHVTLPPSVLATLPEAELRHLRVLCCAGEALPAGLAHRWAAGRRMFNLYGPTETTIWATIEKVDPAYLGPSIGRAIEGTHVGVVDSAQRPVPDGEPGELVIGGAGIARGYHGRPALTAERFVPDPGVAGGRLYRTGDRVRRCADGRLEFLGRIDRQIKLRGFRIEPDEVAAVLREHPGVTDAVVVAKGEGDRARLVGYAVTTGPPSGPVGTALRAFLAERLPEHLVPAAVVVLDELPLTPSGKIDRAALPEPDRYSVGLDAERAAPRTPAERRLATIVGDLLGLADVGVYDDFFALGGHSLLAGRLTARVRAEFGVELPASAVYRAPTVAGLAAAVNSANPTTLPPLVPADRDRPIPLSLPQERVWFLEKLAPGNLAYNAQATIRLRGPLDAESLRLALAEVVRRHEIFRTGFVDTADGPVQRPVPAVELPFEVVEPCGQTSEEIVAERLRQPFDLARPPLARWTLIRHAADDHTLVHVEHHLVHDGWSFAVFLDELIACYTAIVAGRTPTLPEPACQYVDFSVWQRAWMRGPTLRAHLDHWTAELAGIPAALTLPTDRPRPPVPSFVGAALRIELPAELCRVLREFSRSHGVTLYTTMLAGFAALLRLHSGQTDLVIGNGVADRRLAEIERMIGMVVNTLPLRVDAGGRPTFSELVRRVHQSATRAYEWSGVPFDALVEALAPARDPSRNPIFQVMFNFHDSAVPDLDFAGLTGTVLERHNGSAKTDLNIVVVPRAEQRVGRAPRDDTAPITMIWEYATDLFDGETVQRLVDQYRTLLTQALADPARPVSRLDLLSPAETAQVVEEYNRTAAPYPAERTIVEVFADRVADDPDAVAVIGDGTRLSYAQLDERAERLARSLRRCGVGLDTPVGVLIERGPDMIVAFLAALKAGGAYVPLDPGYPRERLGWMLADIRTPVVVTRAALRDRLPDGSAVTVVLIDAAAADGPEPVDAAAAPLPTSLAYVLYTSGSTGRPKGVMVGHRAVLRLVCGTDYVTFGPGDRLAQVADASFDALTYEVWGALLNGGAVSIIPTEAVLSPGRLGEELRKHEITGMFLTSALFNEVMSEYPDSFASLDHLLVGGDALNPARIRQLLHAGGAPGRLLNGYGPTETTTFAVVHHITALAEDATSVPIGRPIANTTVYVLDAEFRPVPLGVAGELHIGGPGVARGYAGRPALTAERFVPDPYSPGARLYRTGDLVRWRPDGTLEFLGRLDNQVKIRGYRIEPGEVESALGGHPALANAAVIVDGQSADKRLLAYVVPADTAAAPSPAQLRRYLAGKLPPYLVPAGFVVLPELPLTPSGKLDRNALPVPAVDRAGGAEGGLAPRDSTEAAVAAICAELLGVPSVGVEDDFFALGGHSLLAMRLVSRVNRTLHADVPLRRFLGTPNVATLAAAVGESAAPPPSGADRASADVLTAGAWRRDDRLLARVDQLSDDEVERLLSEMAESEPER